jgi:chromosome partitioning protein
VRDSLNDWLAKANLNLRQEMKNILIANAKGGCGKTTIATNLAGYFASQGNKTALADLDRQQSSTQWLARRPSVLPDIFAYNAHNKQHLPKPEWLITDSPAGFRDEKLSEAVKSADFVIVPIQPSAFDINATADFLNMIEREKAIRKHKTFIALVGMRVNARTHATAALTDFMEYTGIPILTSLRNAQVYSTAAELGVSIFDLRPSFVAQDLAQWQPLIDLIHEVTSSEK